MVQCTQQQIYYCNTVYSCKLIQCNVHYAWYTVLCTRAIFIVNKFNSVFSCNPITQTSLSKHCTWVKCTHCSIHIHLSVSCVYSVHCTVTVQTLMFYKELACTQCLLAYTSQITLLSTTWSTTSRVFRMSHWAHGAMSCDRCCCWLRRRWDVSQLCNCVIIRSTPDMWWV